MSSENSPETHGKVIQVTEPDGEIYYLPFGEDPFEAFGTEITIQVFDLTNPQPYSEGGE